MVTTPATAAQMTEVVKSEETEVTAAADNIIIFKKDIEASEASFVSESEEIKHNDDEILIFIHERSQSRSTKRNAYMRWAKR